MAWGLSVAARNARLAATIAQIDGGGSAGTVQIRSGARPASPAVAATGTLLATVALKRPSFAAPASGAAAVVDPDPAAAVAAGTASWCRVLDSAGAAVMDGDVTGSGGGGDIELATTALTAGLQVDITGGSITEP